MSDEKANVVFQSPLLTALEWEIMAKAILPDFDFGRGPGMAALPVPSRAPLVDWLRVGFRVACPPIVIAIPKTAKNRRRARARWRAREARRNAGSQGLSPAALAATALPAPAPTTVGSPERGELLDYSDHAGTPAGAEKLRPFPIRLIPQILDEFEEAGLVPLPEKPKPVERPYVPMRWGEHG